MTETSDEEMGPSPSSKPSLSTKIKRQRDYKCLKYHMLGVVVGGVGGFEKFKIIKTGEGYREIKIPTGSQ